LQSSGIDQDDVLLFRVWSKKSQLDSPKAFTWPRKETFTGTGGIERRPAFAAVIARETV
jgi:hypothetical protein